MADLDVPRRRRAFDHRLRRMRGETLKPEIRMDNAPGDSNVALDCGWGRLHLGSTYEDPQALVSALLEEGPGKRDIAVYVRDPHVLLAAAPQDLFLDPSHMFRVDLATYRAAKDRRAGFHVRRICSRTDAEAINQLYAKRGMVPVPPEFFWTGLDPRAISVLVAEEDETGEIVGTAMGVDHDRISGGADPGASLWCLAVSPQARFPGVGEALVRRLAELFMGRGRAHLDLSVLHDNELAIGLYEKLGFVRVPFFTVKKKNTINEALYAGPATTEALNPYAGIIVNEARRRGIRAEVMDAEAGFFRLSYGGRSVKCRESLSEFTSGVALSICDDKSVTRRVVEAAGVSVPAQMVAGSDKELARFLAKHKQVVVKPARGEQGRGIAIGLTALDETRAAIDIARKTCSEVLVEEYVEGMDLRLVVIDYKVVAVAVRRPPEVTGDGRTPIAELIAAQSRRRSAATGGESTIPVDAETERCLALEGVCLDDVLPAGRTLQVRKTANLHTGGTIHDVTGETHGALIEAAVRAAKAIEIPVTGIDFMVKSPRDPFYRFIEANERPGLANHEPQPTAERFIDFLFPLSMPQPVREVWRGREA